MKENQLVDLSRKFAVDIIRLYDLIRETKKYTVIINQLIRCGTSIGANIHEGNYAASRADFINKFQIALKECYETEYWLELLYKAEIVSDVSKLIHDCGVIRRMLISSINTAKENIKNA